MQISPVAIALFMAGVGCGGEGPPVEAFRKGDADDPELAEDVASDGVVDPADAGDDPDRAGDAPAVADVLEESSEEAQPEAGEPVEEVAPEPEPEPVTVLAVGDIAECSVLGYLGLVRDPHELTADIVAGYPAETPVLTLGDHVYSDGTSLEFAVCYDKAWGAFRERTYPCPGNHDYNTDDAEGYFGYFGARAGDPDRGYYAFELGEWLVLSLNSNCGDVACDAESEQVQWLQRQLEDSPSRCTLAYWHHPRWSSDRSGDSPAMAPFVEALHEADVDLALVGHAHNYERVAPQTPGGELDAERGLRQLVVGTGGADLRGMEVATAHSEVFVEAFGVLELTLYADRYAWRFLTVDGDVADSGEQPCH